MNKFKKTLLVITDGIGHNPDEEFNAFAAASKPTYDYLFQNTPHSLIKTSGLAVGLPEGQMGNSEVGHMTIGSGRVLYQNLIKISKACDEGTLEKDEKLLNFLNKTSRVHIIGLLSDGGIHSHIDHFIKISSIVKSFKKELFMHPITDGRDVSPFSSKEFIKKLNEAKLGEISTISGRFYAMDRDKRWERVKSAYDVLVNVKNKTLKTPISYIDEMYKEGISDEFIEPVAFGNYDGIKDGDGIIFINFRNDRMREIVSALGDKEFNHFKTVSLNLKILTMTKYDDTFSYPILFESNPPKPTLSEVISEAGLKQFHTAETEKYAHVTFFLNGGVETPVFNETRVLIPSPKVVTYDALPQMSAKPVCEATCKAMRDGYDFIIVNFANGDMVGHTGNFEAAIKAVESVDEALGEILEVAKEEEYNLIITSDHGNCEAMKSENGERLTNHTLFDVFCFILSPKVKEVKSGGLSNIAPTVLKLMELDIPKEMDEPLI